MYGRKKKDKPVKKMKSEECSTCGDTQHKVPKMVEENKKIKPKEVFGANYSNTKDKKKEKKKKK